MLFHIKGISPFIVLLGLISSSCNNDSSDAAPQRRPTPLPTIEVAVQSVATTTQYPTRIEGTVNSAVRAKVAGYITDVMVEEGQQVKKGQLLFKLETQSLSQDAGAAKAQVDAAQVEVNRLKPLVEKGIISKVQLQTAEANLAKAKSSYNGVTANIDYANIKSPVDGVIGTINYRAGSLASPSDPMPITTVADIENVYANFSMNEKEYLDFLQSADGQTLKERIENFPLVSLKLANGSSYSEKGKIETVSGQVNKTTGTVNFRARFDNPNHLLTNGNSGTILIPVNYDSVLVVPESSTFEQQGQNFVYTLNEKNEATPKRIEVQTRAQDLVIIKSGIEKGEVIIAKGVGKIRSGSLIEPKPIPFEEVNSFETAFK